MSSRPPAVLAVTAVGLALCYAIHRRRLVSRVPAELRIPQLYLPRPILGPLTLALARRRSRDTEPLPGIRVTRTITDSVPTYLYEALDRPAVSGVVLWLHGGGRVAGRAALDHRVCSYLAGETGYLVVSADYRLAPEHPFPAGLDDAMTVLGWIHRHAARAGVDPGQVVVAGASAGGGLAAEACQRAHDEGISVARQVLVYPMLDDRTAGSNDSGRSWLGWSAASNRYAWRAYLARAQGDPPAYAAAARRDDLRGLPPAWIGVGDLDPFFVEDGDYARRLRAAGVPCVLDIVAGMYHAADLAVDPQPASMAEFWKRMATAVSNRPAEEEK